MTSEPSAAPHHAGLAYAFGPPHATGVLRREPEDFVVEEELGFAPDGAGEHALLRVRKRDCNTEWVARELARHAGIAEAGVGYAGLKDRRAVATQWFSVHLPGRAEPDWKTLESASLQVLIAARHERKLRRGALRANRFAITVRGLQGDIEDLKRRLDETARRGVPNYFGEQRFGHGGGNLERAEAMLAGRLRVRDRHKRSLYLSAARSWLFNRVLSLRVERGIWDRALAGDVMMLEGSHSLFPIAAVDGEIARRVAALDIHPTGPLWGRGEPLTRLDSRHLEEDALTDLAAWRQGLERAGLTQERRSLRLKLDALGWEIDPRGDLHVGLRLPPGGYATAVLRELLHDAGTRLGGCD